MHWERPRKNNLQYLAVYNITNRDIYYVNYFGVYNITKLSACDITNIGI